MSYNDEGIFSGGTAPVHRNNSDAGTNYKRITRPVARRALVPSQPQRASSLAVVPVDLVAATAPNDQFRQLAKWMLIGVGVGVAVHLVRKSVWMQNPAKETKQQIASAAAAIAVQANIPVILWGPPGIGKTDWITALAATMGLKEGKGLEIVIGSTRDPSDVVGIVMPDRSIRVPQWVDSIQKRSKKGRRSLLFLDEFSLMTPLVQAAFLRVIRDKVAGETNLEAGCGDCVAVVAAANRPDESVGGMLLPPPSANRLIHIDWPEPDAREWIKGLLFGWETLRPDLAKVKLPQDWRDRPQMQQAKKDIADFIATIGELSEMPKDTRRHYAWPSPRSWDNAATALGCARIVGASDEVQNALVAGAVGQAQADEFYAYTTQKDLPDPEAILEDPTSWSPPSGQVIEIKSASGQKKTVPIKRNDIIYAVIYSVVVAVRRNVSAERWLRAWDFIMHLDNVTGPEQKAVIVIGASSLMEMIGQYKELDWTAAGIVAKKIGREKFGWILQEMVKANLFDESVVEDMKKAKVI
jgi:MoxR-like ATPase